MDLSSLTMMHFASASASSFVVAPRLSRILYSAVILQTILQWSSLQNNVKKGLFYVCTR